MSIQRKRALLIAIFLFFAAAIAQPLGGNLETWPFSFFGMYSGMLSRDDLVQVQIDYQPPNGEPRNVFPGENGYYVCEKISFLLSDTVVGYNNGILSEGSGVRVTPEKINEIIRVVRLDVVPMILRKNWNDPEAKIIVHFKYWKLFSFDKRFQPDRDQILYSASLKELL